MLTCANGTVNDTEKVGQDEDLGRLLDRINAIDASALDTPIPVPDRKSTVVLLKLVQTVLLPRFYRFKDWDQARSLQELSHRLENQIRLALQLQKRDCSSCREKSRVFLEQLPRIKAEVLTDIQAIYEGDPSAPCLQEIVICYPGFYATFIYRIAHVLYQLDVPFLPRIMSEYAHEKTGIDINPGARIGTSFCIDHGTGIVIGQTARLGDHVKLYQGVTLGARSFKRDSAGAVVKGGKRHPDVGSRVTIYANATVLGGDTVIGDDCVIGADVWVTHSVPAGQKVLVGQKNSSRL